MRLPPHMIFHHDLHLLVFRPRGILTEKRVDKDLAIFELAEDQVEAPFNRFTDLSKVKAIRLNFQQIFRISLHRRLKYGKRPAVKSAFYITTAEAARIVKTHALLTGYSPIQVQMFEDLEPAAKWLGVSVEDLQMGSGASLSSGSRLRPITVRGKGPSAKSRGEPNKAGPLPKTETMSRSVQRTAVSRSPASQPATSRSPLNC